MARLCLLLKRTLLLCAFLLYGCSEPAQTKPSKLNDDHTSGLATPAASSTANSPLLSLQELLNATDVKHGLASAAKQNDEAQLRLWQNALLMAADEVNLAPRERALISGKQGLKYLAFQGMKTNYQTAFEEAFVSFGDVDKVYSDYPAFIDLHKRSIKLVEQRDELVARVRQELKKNGYEGDPETEAKRQWQNFFLTEQAREKNPKLLQTRDLD